MGKLKENVYELNSIPSKQWLLDHGFIYNKTLSNDDTDVYTYRFPVLKYNSYTTLECGLSIIFGDNKIKIDVYDYGTRDKYAPFYYTEYGNHTKILNTIWFNIDHRIKQIKNVKVQRGRQSGNQN